MLQHMQIRRRYNQRSKALLFPRRHFNKSHSTEPLFVLLMTTAKICIVIKTIKLNLLRYIPFTRLPLGSVRCADDTLLNISHWLSHNVARIYMHRMQPNRRVAKHFGNQRAAFSRF